MEKKKSVWVCGAILLVAHLFGGCVSPAPLHVPNYFSTFDHEAVVPNERVLRHGPYKLDLYPMIADLQGKSIFYAPKRNDKAWRTESEFCHNFRDVLERTSEEHFSHPKRPDLPDLMMGTAWTWISMSKDPKFASNTLDFAFLPRHTNEAMQAMSYIYRCWVFGGKNANCRMPEYDFPKMRQSTAQQYPLLFPDSGKGKRLNLAALHVLVYAGEDPDIPCGHHIWAVYLQGGGRVPMPRFSFMTFSMESGVPISPLGWDATTGKATLKSPGGDVPLHSPSKPLPQEYGLPWNYYRELSETRFAAAVIQLLNTLTDEELDELEATEWGPNEYQIDKAEYDNNGVDILRASVACPKFQ